MKSWVGLRTLFAKQQRRLVSSSRNSRRRHDAVTLKTATGIPSTLRRNVFSFAGDLPCGLVPELWPDGAADSWAVSNLFKLNFFMIQALRFGVVLVFNWQNRTRSRPNPANPAWNRK